MAGNKKIFELPLRTGVTIDDRLAIVDSGNTTTYSVKVSDLRDGVGVNTLDTLTGDIVFSAGTNMTITDNGVDTITFTSTGGGGGSSFFSGDTTEPSNIIQIDRGHSITYGTGAIEDNFFLGGSGNTINASVGTAQPYYRNVLLGGFNNTLFPDFSNASWSSNNTAIIAGNNNRIGRQSDDSVIIGGGSNYIGYGNDNFIIGGTSNNMTGSRCFILGGSTNSVAGTNSSVVGGTSHISRGNDTSVVGGNNNEVQINCLRSASIGGLNHLMSAAGYDDSVFVGGQNNTIAGDSSSIIGGNSNTISHNRSVILGGSSQSTSIDDEVVVPNLTITNYASLNYADDTAAAAGGVPLGGVYHNAGDLRVRII